MSFFLDFLASDISLDTIFHLMKFHRHGDKMRIEGMVSQVVFIGPSFCFKKSRKKMF